MSFAYPLALVAIVSDFRGPLDWRRPLLQVAARHDVVAVEIRDPREQALPKFGQLRLVDPETGRQIKVDTSSETLRTRFAAAAAQERSEVASEMTRRADACRAGRPSTSRTTCGVRSSPPLAIAE